MLCSILAVFLLLASNIVDDADGPGEEEDEGGGPAEEENLQTICQRNCIKFSLFKLVGP